MFQKQLTCNPDLVQVVGCRVAVFLHFSSFKSRLFIFQVPVCPFKCRVLPYWETERKIETVRKSSASCPLKHATAYFQEKWWVVLLIFLRKLKSNSLSIESCNCIQSRSPKLQLVQKLRD